MAEIPGDLRAALSALPLFPLPEVVLFPGTLLPLHVFEPRYRTLVRDVLETHRCLSVVRISGAGELDAHGHPSIASVAGVGIIVDHAELPGGRFNIVVRGRARVSLEELPFVPPYRRARAEILRTESESVSAGDIAALVSSATAFASVVQSRDSSFDFRLPRDADAGALADHCAGQLLIDGRDRQAVLEATTVSLRVKLVTETLAMQRLALGSLSGAPN